MNAPLREVAPVTAAELSRRTAPGILATTWIVLRKDLLLEWRTRARLNALLFFALATLLLFSFALGPDTKLLARNAGGYFWLALLFSSVLALGESFRVESENMALDGLRLAPTDARGIFLGKALGNALLLFGMGSLILPVMIALYGVSLEPGAVGQFFLVLLLGCLAICAPGTIYSAVAHNARARDVLLPLLLFPLIIPALLAATKATSLALHGDPMDQMGSWLALLCGFDVVYWGLGMTLFGRVIEE